MVCVDSFIDYKHIKIYFKYTVVVNPRKRGLVSMSLGQRQVDS